MTLITLQIHREVNAFFSECLKLSYMSCDFLFFLSYIVAYFFSLCVLRVRFISLIIIIHCYNNSILRLIMLYCRKFIWYALRQRLQLLGYRLCIHDIRYRHFNLTLWSVDLMPPYRFIFSNENNIITLLTLVRITFKSKMVLLYGAYAKRLDLVDLAFDL